MQNNARFTETVSAANLLDAFYSLSEKTGKRYVRSNNPAAATFFGKDFLTIADFLAPIGEVLIVPAARVKENTVRNFITSNLHRSKKTGEQSQASNQKKKETIAEFFGRL